MLHGQAEPADGLAPGRPAGAVPDGDAVPHSTVPPLSNTARQAHIVWLPPSFDAPPFIPATRLSGFGARDMRPPSLRLGHLSQYLGRTSRKRPRGKVYRNRPHGNSPHRKLGTAIGPAGNTVPAQRCPPRGNAGGGGSKNALKINFELPARHKPTVPTPHEIWEPIRGGQKLGPRCDVSRDFGAGADAGFGTTLDYGTGFGSYAGFDFSLGTEEAQPPNRGLKRR